MAQLILLRHGASMWNDRNMFTGWVDIPLSRKGVEEALEAGMQISSISINVIFTSALIRSQMTALLAMSVHEEKRVPQIIRLQSDQQEIDNRDPDRIPVYPAWQLNERMYGELQGKNKDAMRSQYGVEQVEIWRRDFDAVPPGGESLKQTAERVIPYFQERVVPHLRKGDNLLLCAHSNSLRIIVMFLENSSFRSPSKVEFKTGVPLFYSFCDERWNRDG